MQNILICSKYNLLEYSNYCFMTSRSLWNYYRNEVSHSAKRNKDKNKEQQKNSKYVI